MRQSLLERCEAQVRCETALRKAHRFDYEQIIKLGGLMFANAGREPDAARLKECKKLIKQKAGIFSNFRGSLGYIVLVKMALADDPEAFIDGTLAIYDRLKSGRVFAGELMAMAAMTIYEHCPADSRDEVVDKTREAYAKCKEQHRFLTDDADTALIALLVIAGFEPDQVAQKVEELYLALKDRGSIRSDTAQAAAMVLALYDAPTAQKVQDYFAVYEACKDAGCATGKDKSMAVYAAFEGIDAELTQAVAEIDEVEDWLKDHKGYGMLGVGASMRHLFAAALVLEDRQEESAAATESISSAVTQVIVEEITLILISILVTCIIISTTTASHS